MTLDELEGTAKWTLANEGLAAALPLLVQATEQAERQEPTTSRTAQLLWLLYETHQQLGVTSDTSEALLRRLVAAQQPGPSRDLAYTLHLLGNQISQLGHYDEAQQHYAEALDLATNLPTAAENRAFLLQQLAYVHAKHGQLAAAVATLREGLDCSAEAGLPVPTSARVTLAQWLTDTAPAEAEEVLHDCLRSDQEYFGDNSFDVGLRHLDLAQFYERHGQHAEARGAYEQAIARLAANNSMGEADGLLVDAHLTLAHVLAQLQEPAAALTALRQAAELCATVAPDSQLLADIRLRLADQLLDHGYSQEARGIYKWLQAYEAAHPNPDPKDVTPVLLLNRQGITCEIEGRYAEAIACYQQAWDLLTTRFGPAHADLPWVAERLAACQAELGQLPEGGKN